MRDEGRGQNLFSDFLQVTNLSLLHQLGQNAAIQKKRNHADVNNPVVIRQRLRIAPCDDDLPEKVSAALERQLLLFGFLLRVQGERRLDVDLVIAAIDDEIYLVLACLLDAVLSRIIFSSMTENPLDKSIQISLVLKHSSCLSASGPKK